MNSPAAPALASVLHRGDHIIPIPGTHFEDHLAEDAEGAKISLSAHDLAEIEDILPVGFVHGARYSAVPGRGASGGMMVEAAPTTTFVTAKSGLLLELLIVARDAPSQLA